jgi:Effector-associated domain 7
MDLSKLSEKLKGCFNLSELNSLCFELGISIEDIPKRTISEVAVEIVKYFNRRGEIPNLLSKLEETRPNVNWRKLTESPGTENKRSEYEREVLLEISLACHKWKNEYLTTVQAVDDKKQDIWEAMLNNISYKYSKTEWKAKKYLFDEIVDQVTQRLEFICASYGDAIDNETKAIIVREVRVLRVQQFVYGVIPKLITTAKVSPTNEIKNGFFSVPFHAVIKSLAKLARRVEGDHPS